MSEMLRLPRPVAYAEAPELPETALDRFGRRVAGHLRAGAADLRAWQARSILRHVRRHEARLSALSEAELQREARDLAHRLRVTAGRRRFPPRLSGQAFALTREVCHRVLGLRPYDVQVTGAWVMLSGQVAEMRTGEGKTITAGLAAALAALSGRQVHVMTVNDYLAERDLAQLAPFYAFLGLGTAVLLEGQDDEVRRQLHRAPIVYGTNKSFAFDYLRDRQVLRHRPGNLRRKLDVLTRDPAASELRVGGLQVALVDEADSVLIDEARTPLIISGQVEALPGQDAALFHAAMAAARQMVEGTHFKVPRHARQIELTETGLDWLDEIAEEAEAEGGFAVPVIREHAVSQALSALHLQVRGDSYIIKDGAVQIVDENTGRTMADRSWSDGLHQMVELKEGLEMSALRETLARITYQRFFRRYGLLAGMTGTARDAAGELWEVYRLDVARIPTHRGDRRRYAPDRVYTSAAARWQAVAKRAAELQARGVPVLIGARSVGAAQAASAALTEKSVAHGVLSAAQDADEAQVVAQAGQPGTVTVATNMAGRGTDIRLGEGVAEKGGLHVLLTERHDSRRVDRQLQGRAGRQGDPGRCEAFLSLEDELMQGPAAARLRRQALWVSRLLGPRAAGPWLRWRQRQVEGQHAQLRRALLDSDRDLTRLLAISGDME